MSSGGGRRMTSNKQDDSGRKFKGRGNAETMETETGERYSGRGSIFDRLDRDSKEGPLKSVEGWIVFIRGVHEEATEEDITDKFSAFGSIKNLQMPLDRRSGFVKGYAMVEYESRNEAEKAIKEMNSSPFLQKTITVDWAFSRGK